MITFLRYDDPARVTLVTVASGRDGSHDRQYALQAPGFSRISSCAFVISLRELATRRGCGPLLAQVADRLRLERTAREAKARRTALVAQHRSRHVRAPRPL